jgi:hypothetical protein
MDQKEEHSGPLPRVLRQTKKKTLKQMTRQPQGVMRRTQHSCHHKIERGALGTLPHRKCRAVLHAQTLAAQTSHKIHLGPRSLYTRKRHRPSKLAAERREPPNQTDHCKRQRRGHEDMNNDMRCSSGRELQIHMLARTPDLLESARLPNPRQVWRSTEEHHRNKPATSKKPILSTTSCEHKRTHKASQMTSHEGKPKPSQTHPKKTHSTPAAVASAQRQLPSAWEWTEDQ